MGYCQERIKFANNSGFSNCRIAIFHSTCILNLHFILINGKVKSHLSVYYISCQTKEKGPYNKKREPQLMISNMNNFTKSAQAVIEYEDFQVNPNLAA